ncbi:S49 family peptidase, partial [Acinetobacter baumannii]|nr:S49 family peptidase [Acinetobacter baumannii]
QAAINAIAAKYQQPRQKTSIQMQAAAMDLQAKM